MKQHKHTSPYTQCLGCGKRILLCRLKFCPDCAKVEGRLVIEGIPADARKVFWAYWREHDGRCFLSGVSLEIDDDTSPWYLVFSRLNPKDKTRVFPAAALFNEMKSRLAKKEFRYYAIALDDCRKKHLRVRKIPLVHWHGLALSYGDKICAGCRHSAAVKGHKFCARCSKISRRMKRNSFSHECMNTVWDYVRKYGYVCYYTGMPLDLDDPNSPWYLVFDHWMPRDPRKIVITSSLVNEMKSDLTEEEFWYFIRQLANFYRHGSVVRKRLLAYWCRPYR